MAALFYKRIRPNEFFAEKILFSFLRSNCPLANHDSRFAINAHLQIVHLEFAENDVAGHRLQSCPFIHDFAVGPGNRAIFRIESPRV